MLAFGLLIQATISVANPSPSLTGFQQQIRDAYVAVEAAQSKKPPAKDASEQLIRLGERDQAGRIAYQQLDFSQVPENQRTAWRTAIFSEITRHDKIYQDELKSLIPAEGWFKLSVYGKEASRAAFLIVQHAVNDTTFMKSVLQKLEKFVQQGEAEGQLYAMMYDRVALEFDQKPQLYGTQVKCDDGKWGAYNLLEPEKIDERRKSIGMTQTYQQYLAMFDNSKCS